MALVEFKLHVAYALLHSDWLAQNLELESGNPGRSTHTYSSFPPPSHLRTRMRIRGNICLVRETSVRACVFVCVWLRVCVCFRAFWVSFRWCGRACVCFILCVCFRMSVSAYIFLHALKHPLTHEHTLTLMHTCTHARSGVYVRACLCTCVCTMTSSKIKGIPVGT